MDCLRFDQLLDALLDGRCRPDDWNRAREHMAACPRCRQLFEALSGRADTLDDPGHASLTEAIMSRTSGRTCASARDRLCDFVDGALGPLDRELVEGHLAGCQACCELAGALARALIVLPTFAEIEPPASLASSVLAATSRRTAEPSLAEKAGAWLTRAAMRPRFSVSVAYAATLLVVLAVGDPVSAFRRTVDRGAEYVQPAVVAVGERVASRFNSARQVGAETLGAVEAVVERPEGTSRSWNAGLSAVQQWLVSNLGAPLAGLIERVSQWVRSAMDAIIHIVRPEPPKQARTEPFRRSMRLT